MTTTAVNQIIIDLRQELTLAENKLSEYRRLERQHLSGELLQELETALRAMQTEAAARNCGLRITDEILAKLDAARKEANA